MKKSLFLSTLLAGVGALACSSANAQTTLTNFTAGAIVVERVGDGAAPLTSAGTAVFLDEYSLAGTLLGTYALPTGGALPLVESGTATSGGGLTLSTNGQYLVLPGYNAVPGTAGVTGATSAAIPREVATVSASLGLVQTTINNFSGNNIRSAASVDGTTIYAAGANTGILAVTSGAVNTAGTVISNTSTNNRQVAIFNNQLYLSSSSGTFRLATVGTGVPTTTGQTAVNLPGITSANVAGPYSFVATTLTLGGTTADTVYVADNTTGAIEKFSLVAGTFTLTGTAPLAGVTGLTGMTVGTTETLVATTAAGVFTLTDLTGFNGTLVATPNQIVTAGANTAFRGVAFAPTAVPEPSAFALLAAVGCGGFLLLARRRRSAA